MTTLVAAVLVMLVLTLLLVPSLVCGLYVSVCICSIIGGLAGYGQYFGYQLDNAVLFSLVMSVGFSVDYCAHIAFAYVNSAQHGCSTTKDKLDNALEVICHALISLL